MQRISATVTSQQNAQLRALSKETGIGLTELVRRALSDFLKVNQPKEIK
jgi:hypothetical protein